MADPVSVVRGPLAPFAEDFRSGLLERGYAPLSIVNQLRQVARLSCWLGERGLGAADVSEGRISEFLAFQRAGGRYRKEVVTGGPDVPAGGAAPGRRGACGGAVPEPVGGGPGGGVLRALPAGRAGPGRRHHRGPGPGA